MLKKCENCSHNATCKFEDTYARVEDIIDKTNIYTAEKDGELEKKRIKDLSFVRSINIVCKYFEHSSIKEIKKQATQL